ncbi:HXXEE domain-containing protein [Fodinisporobacter ferrooxydans]|uniref:HXXEE domain-containing protein n=1 Tax=Fodinisporobacter ferrooxydans TaxID=2901836 RepID=A0ABY4CH51_9BACL|nr:HXXEE domain-containing protein [Alicyclobacillaceae bacterium MYW30-H2]
MIYWLDTSISLQSLIWLFLAVFMVHDFEEIIWVESWIDQHFDSLYSSVPRILRRNVESFRGMKSSQFALAVALEFIVFIPFTWLAAVRHQYLFFLEFYLILFAHVFSHIGQSFYLRNYTHSVATAVSVNFPYSLHLFYRLNQAGIIHSGAMLMNSFF